MFSRRVFREVSEDVLLISSMRGNQKMTSPAQRDHLWIQQDEFTAQRLSRPLVHRFFSSQRSRHPRTQQKPETVIIFRKRTKTFSNDPFSSRVQLTKNPALDAFSMEEATDSGSGRPKRATLSTNASPAQKKLYAATQIQSWCTENVKLNQEGEIVLGDLVAKRLIVRCRRKAT
jgi:hypothetical protein